MLSIILMWNLCGCVCIAGSGEICHDKTVFSDICINFWRCEDWSRNFREDMFAANLLEAWTLGYTNVSSKWSFVAGMAANLFLAWKRVVYASDCGYKFMNLYLYLLPSMCFIIYYKTIVIVLIFFLYSQLAEKELQKINALKAPREKVLCIMNCCRIINNLLLNASISENVELGGADDFLPVLIYIIIKARFPW